MTKMLSLLTASSHSLISVSSQPIGNGEESIFIVRRVKLSRASSHLLCDFSECEYFIDSLLPDVCGDVGSFLCLY